MRGFCHAVIYISFLPSFLTRTLPEERANGSRSLVAPSRVRMVLTSLHIPEAQLYVSEPPPQMFGNSANEKDPLWTNTNWLKSRFHFSFAEYRNPKNTQFGVLR